MSLQSDKPLRVLVTAGPTREWLDPVRFISNPSTGVMGYAIARAAQALGMRVTLLSGPVTLPIPKGLRFISFESTDELSRFLKKEFPKHDILFMTAAVGDYVPVSRKQSKIKRHARLRVTFRQSPDLLAELAPLKKRPLVVGFCLETEHLIRHAQKKLAKKNLDFIVANFLGRNSRPFGAGKTNAVLIARSGAKIWFRNMKKPRLAAKLIQKIIQAGKVNAGDRNRTGTGI